MCHPNGSTKNTTVTDGSLQCNCQWCNHQVSAFKVAQAMASLLFHCHFGHFGLPYNLADQWVAWISYYSFIHSFIRGGGWPLAVFRRAFQPTASAEA